MPQADESAPRPAPDASRQEPARAASSPGPGAASGSKRPCPICRRPVAGDAPHFPFCTDRCRTIDLGRWATQSYVISRPLEQRDLDEE